MSDKSLTLELVTPEKVDPERFADLRPFTAPFQPIAELLPVLENLPAAGVLFLDVNVTALNTDVGVHVGQIVLQRT